MNIFLITNTFPVLTETFVFRQALKLKAKIIATNINDSRHFDTSSIDVFEVKSKYPKLFRKYKNFLFKIFKIFKYDWTYSQYKQAEIILKQQKPDILLGVFGQNGIVAAKLGEKLNLPYIIQMLGVDASKFLKYNSYKNELIHYINKSQFSIALSNEMKGDLVKAGAIENKIIVHNIGVPVEKFEQLKLNEKGFCKFIAIGRMVEKKSPLSTIKAFEICADANPVVSLEFIGDGPLFEEVKNYVYHSRHKSKINLHGYKSITEINSIIKISHVFLQHSVTSKEGDKEGWPVAIAEACSYGLPVISTKHSGIKEQIESGINGYLVEEHDVEGMAKYMVELSNDFDKCVNFGNMSRELIVQRGSLTLQIKRLEKLIRESYI